MVAYVNYLCHALMTADKAPRNPLLAQIEHRSLGLAHAPAEHAGRLHTKLAQEATPSRCHVLGGSTFREAAMDDADTTTPAATSVTMAVGQVIVTVETSVGLTPEMTEDVLIRCRRQVVATIQELGLTREAPAEDATP